MTRQKILVIADLGGCPPHMFYESVAEKYNIISYIPRPFAITQTHARLIETYSVAIIKDMDYFQHIRDFEHPESIYWAHEEYAKSEAEVVEDIVRIAKQFDVSAITTNNELFIAPMAKACERLGLRGAGAEAAVKARDKNRMRESFNRSGVKAIRSYRVTTLDDFQAAIAEVGFPLVLKPTYLASSIGVTFMYDADDAEQLFLQAQAYLQGINVPKAVTYEAPFIVEQFLQGEYDDWYTVPGYSDYVSVEGLMIDGHYYPLAIHDKTPQIGFTETAHITSTILDYDAQQRIIEAVKKANEGLGLQYCATHTEVKLMKNREVGIIETAARFAGWNMIPNIKKAFGIDAAQLLADILCDGYSQQLPAGLLTAPATYVADFHLYPHDFIVNGQLAQHAEQLLFERIELGDEVLAGDTVITSYHTIAAGTLVDLSLFEAFNGLAYLELQASRSEHIVQTIQNMKQNARLVSGKDPVSV
ncbi:ATP-grasp domain-containing protein [Paenibacillus campi]|uniref:ATP-grasp domain-containing protein n=1 Tax=Paenibacillus campi TaxID=3106031 RepID=UPI002AFF7C18|nr:MULTISPECIES: ATP-grasp domain-containing protein [unclassified Paenibacillus]